jgi:hypothetical protein
MVTSGAVRKAGTLGIAKFRERGEKHKHMKLKPDKKRRQQKAPCVANKKKKNKRKK